jgi:hypothetical protein
MKVTAVVLAAAAIGATTAAAAAGPPALHIERVHGLVVSGDHFKAQEHVTVTVSSFGIHVGETVADHGSFRIDFPSFKRATCRPLRIVAVGNRGSRAALSLPAPVCTTPGPRPGPGSNNK